AKWPKPTSRNATWSASPSTCASRRSSLWNSTPPRRSSKRAKPFCGAVRPAASFSRQRLHHLRRAPRYLPRLSASDARRRVLRKPYVADAGPRNLLPHRLQCARSVQDVNYQFPAKEAYLMPKRTPAVRDFAVVCVGGSAGGLDAYTRLLRHLPSDMGVAIVIVNHLRTVATQLHQILPRYTDMPVDLITEKLLIEPNHVFIIPPQRDLHVLKGEFRLKPISKPRGWPD